MRGDARLLQRVVLNLGWNALRHGPPGGTVTLFLEQLDGAWRIGVHDMGAGFPVALSHAPGEGRAQGPAAASAQGFGLGLELVRVVARKHLASLWVEHPVQGGLMIGLCIVCSG